MPPFLGTGDTWSSNSQNHPVTENLRELAFTARWNCVLLLAKIVSLLSFRQSIVKHFFIYHFPLTAGLVGYLSLQAFFIFRHTEKDSLPSAHVSFFLHFGCRLSHRSTFLSGSLYIFFGFFGQKVRYSEVLTLFCQMQTEVSILTRFLSLL